VRRLIWRGPLALCSCVLGERRPCRHHGGALPVAYVWALVCSVCCSRPRNTRLRDTCQTRPCQSEGKWATPATAARGDAGNASSQQPHIQSVPEQAQTDATEGRLRRRAPCIGRLRRAAAAASRAACARPPHPLLHHTRYQQASPLSRISHSGPSREGVAAKTGNLLASSATRARSPRRASTRESNRPLWCVSKTL